MRARRPASLRPGRGEPRATPASERQLTSRRPLRHRNALRMNTVNHDALQRMRTAQNGSDWSRIYAAIAEKGYC